MEEETQDLIEQKKLLQTEIAKYKDSKEEYKDYMNFMDDISTWIQERLK